MYLKPNPFFPEVTTNICSPATLETIRSSGFTMEIVSSLMHHAEHSLGVLQGGSFMVAISPNYRTVIQVINDHAYNIYLLANLHGHRALAAAFAELASTTERFLKLEITATRKVSPEYGNALLAHLGAFGINIETSATRVLTEMRGTPYEVTISIAEVADAPLNGLLVIPEGDALADRQLVENSSDEVLTVVDDEDELPFSFNSMYVGPADVASDNTAPRVRPVVEAQRNPNINMRLLAYQLGRRRDRVDFADTHVTLGAGETIVESNTTLWKLSLIWGTETASDMAAICVAEERRAFNELQKRVDYSTQRLHVNPVDWEVASQSATDLCITTLMSYAIIATGGAPMTTTSSHVEIANLMGECEEEDNAVEKDDALFRTSFTPATLTAELDGEPLLLPHIDVELVVEADGSRTLIMGDRKFTNCELVKVNDPNNKVFGVYNAVDASGAPVTLDIQVNVVDEPEDDDELKIDDSNPEGSSLIVMGDAIDKALLVPSISGDSQIHPSRLRQISHADLYSDPDAEIHTHNICYWPSQHNFPADMPLAQILADIEISHLRYHAARAYGCRTVEFVAAKWYSAAGVPEATIHYRMVEPELTFMSELKCLRLLSDQSRLVSAIDAEDAHTVTRNVLTGVCSDSYRAQQLRAIELEILNNAAIVAYTEPKWRLFRHSPDDERGYSLELTYLEYAMVEDVLAYLEEARTNVDHARIRRLSNGAVFGNMASAEDLTHSIKIPRNLSASEVAFRLATAEIEPLGYHEYHAIETPTWTRQEQPYGSDCWTVKYRRRILTRDIFDTYNEVESCRAAAIESQEFPESTIQVKSLDNTGACGTTSLSVKLGVHVPAANVAQALVAEEISALSEVKEHYDHVNYLSIEWVHEWDTSGDHAVAMWSADLHTQGLNHVPDVEDVHHNLKALRLNGHQYTRHGEDLTFSDVRLSVTLRAFSDADATARILQAREEEFLRQHNEIAPSFFESDLEWVPFNNGGVTVIWEAKSRVAYHEDWHRHQFFAKAKTELHVARNGYGLAITVAQIPEDMDMPDGRTTAQLDVLYGNATTAHQLATDMANKELEFFETCGKRDVLMNPIEWHRLPATKIVRAKFDYCLLGESELAAAAAPPNIPESADLEAALKIARSNLNASLKSDDYCRPDLLAWWLTQRPYSRGDGCTDHAHVRKVDTHEVGMTSKRATLYVDMPLPLAELASRLASVEYMFFEIFERHVYVDHTGFDWVSMPVPGKPGTYEWSARVHYVITNEAVVIPSVDLEVAPDVTEAAPTFADSVRQGEDNDAHSRRPLPTLAGLWEYMDTVSTIMVHTRNHSPLQVPSTFSGKDDGTWGTQRYTLHLCLPFTSLTPDEFVLAVVAKEQSFVAQAAQAGIQHTPISWTFGPDAIDISKVHCTAEFRTRPI